MQPTGILTALKPSRSPHSNIAAQVDLTYTVDEINMGTKLTTCRVRVKWGRGDAPGEPVIQSLKDIKASPDMTDQLRQQWAAELVKSFIQSPDPAAAIRPWDFLLKQDGSVEVLPSSEKGGRSALRGHDGDAAF